MKTRLALFPLFLASGALSAATLTVGTIDGGLNHFPYGGGAIGFDGTRYQQAYDASQFATMGPIAISGLRFFSGEGTLAPTSYTVSFSTIAAGIDTLSNSDFDGNRGADNALFAAFSLSGAAPATLSIAGSNSFTYDPSQGNLLMDIQVSPGLAGTASPAFYAANNGTATGVFSRYHNFGSGNEGYGLVTEFTYDSAVPPVPEPSSMGVVLGIGALLAVARRYRRS